MELGINLSGVPYGLLTTTASIDYFASKGFSTIRLPLDWEQVQPSISGPLDQNIVRQLHEFVSYAEGRGLNVILDLHNYGSYNGNLIGSSTTPISAFANFWGKLAGEFSGDSSISFGLMNEPQLPTASAWLPAANAAIAAIRNSGAVTQQILVSGAYWDGGSSWTQTDNADVIGKPGAVIDPSNNFAFEVHQYLDDTSGQHDWVVSETIGVERLTSITEWARLSGAKLYLGEFGVADNATALVAMTNMLNYVAQNGDVWEGASYWAAGVGWQKYMYSVEPNLGILDMPQMSVLEKFTNARTTSEVLSDGTIEIDTYVDGQSNVSIKDLLDRSGLLLSRTLYNPDGSLSRSVYIDDKGNLDLKIFSNGSASPDTLDVYDSNYSLKIHTVFGDEGAKTVSYYGINEWDVRRVETYALDGNIASVSILGSDGSHQQITYAQGHLAIVENYDSAWHLLNRTSYNNEGQILSILTELNNGSHQVATYAAGNGEPSIVTTYTNSWVVTSREQLDNAGHPVTVEHFYADGSYSKEIPSSSPTLATATSLGDQNGIITVGGSTSDKPNAPPTLKPAAESANFASKGYLAANPDVAKAGVDALTHYHQFGWKEGRDPAADFDNELYLLHNPDVKAAGVDPYQHYLQYGQYEGRPSYAAIGNAASFTHGSFDTEYYLLANPDVATAALAAGGDTLAFAYQHYQTYGWHENRSPDAYFDPAYYLAQNPDVAAAHIDPLAHYDTYGWKEGRNPSASFSTSAYLAANPDVAAAHIDPLKHFLQYGADEGRHLA